MSFCFTSVSDGSLTEWYFMPRSLTAGVEPLDLAAGLVMPLVYYAGLHFRGRTYTLQSINVTIYRTYLNSAAKIQQKNDICK